jgi:hypothetical protein
MTGAAVAGDGHRNASSIGARRAMRPKKAEPDPKAGSRLQAVQPRQERVAAVCAS